MSKCFGSRLITLLGCLNTELLKLPSSIASVASSVAKFGQGNVAIFTKPYFLG